MIDIKSEQKLYIEFNLLYFLQLWKAPSLTSLFLVPYWITTEKTFEIIKEVIIENNILGLIYLVISWSEEKEINTVIFFNKNEYVWFQKLDSIWFKLIDDKSKSIIKNKYDDFLKRISHSYTKEQYIIERKKISNKLKLLYDLNWEKFEIHSWNFLNSEIYFLHFIYSYLHLWFIKLEWVGTTAFDTNNYFYIITITKDWLEEINKKINTIKVKSNNLYIDINDSSNILNIRKSENTRPLWNMDISQSDFWKILKYCFTNDIKWPVELTDIYNYINKIKPTEVSRVAFDKTKSAFINSNKKINKEDIDYLINKTSRGSTLIELHYNRVW